MNEKINVKTSWSEVSLRDFLRLGTIEGNADLIDYRIQQRLRKIDVVCDLGYEKLLTLKKPMLAPILEKTSFIDRHPPKRDQKKPFKINGKEYVFYHDYNNLSAGEMISVEQLIMDAKQKGTNSTPGVLAILFRPTKEDGTIEDFDAKTWAERTEFFLDNLMTDKFFHELAFFLSNGNYSALNTLLSTENPKLKKKKGNANRKKKKRKKRR